VQPMATVAMDEAAARILPFDPVRSQGGRSLNWRSSLTPMVSPTITAIKAMNSDSHFYGLGRSAMAPPGSGKATFRRWSTSLSMAAVERLSQCRLDLPIAPGRLDQPWTYCHPRPAPTLTSSIGATRPENMTAAMPMWPPNASLRVGATPDQGAGARSPTSSARA